MHASTLQAQRDPYLHTLLCVPEWRQSTAAYSRNSATDLGQDYVQTSSNMGGRRVYNEGRLAIHSYPRYLRHLYQVYLLQWLLIMIFARLTGKHAGYADHALASRNREGSANFSAERLPPPVIAVDNPVIRAIFNRDRSVSVASSFNSLFDGPYQEDEEFVGTGSTLDMSLQRYAYGEISDEAMEVDCDLVNYDDDLHSRHPSLSPTPTVVKMEEDYEPVLQWDPIDTHDCVADALVPNAPEREFESRQAVVSPRKKRSRSSSRRFSRNRRSHKKRKVPVTIVKLGRHTINLR
ncbi:hypothetical protein BKA93DRAFT_124905 [Sparassis latifolia]